MAESKSNNLKKLPKGKNLSALDQAIISKLVPRTETGSVGTTADSRNNNRTLPIPDGGTMRHMSNQIARNNADADNLFQVLPEMNLAAEIVVSAVISPGDLVETQILYRMEDDDLDSEISGPILRLIKEHFEKEYRFKDVLTDMVYDILFKRGSYPMLLLPESTIDHVVNSLDGVTMESMRTAIPAMETLYPNYGLVGSGVETEERTGLESLRQFAYDSSRGGQAHTIKVDLAISTESSEKIEGFDTLIEVRDNPDFVKNPMLLEKARKMMVGKLFTNRRAAVRTSLEAVTPTYKDRPKLIDIEKVFYTDRKYERVPLTMLATPKQLNRETVGHPVVMHLSSESVIPVHIPGNPKHHIGYFVPVDQDGNPLTVNMSNDYYGDIRSQLDAQSTVSSQLLAQTVNAQDGSKNCQFNRMAIQQLTNTYSHLVENDLKNRLRSGAMTGNYELAVSEEVMAMMFTRSLQKKRSVFMFVPAELMSYIAVDFNARGIGKSLIEDGKMLGAIRAITLFANTMAAMRNATGTQTLRLKVPEKSGDPYADVEFMLNEYARINQQGFPFADTHPVGMITALQNMGKNIVVEDHPAFPSVGFDVEDRPGTHREIDNTFSDELKRRHIQMFGLTPEAMDAAAGADFATNVITNNFYLIKRSIKTQEILCPQLTEFVRRYTQFSGILREGIRDIIGDKPKMPEGIKTVEEYIDYLIDVVVIDLPRPQTKKVEDQLKSFKDYSDSIEEYLAAYVDEKFLDATTAAGAYESVDSVKAAIRGLLQRKWLRDNAIATELDVLFSATEDNGPTWKLMDDMNEYTQGMLNCVEEYMKKSLPAASKRAERIRKLQEKNPTDATADAGGMEEEETSFDTETDDTTDDLGDLGLDSDTPPDDTPSETDEPEVEEEETPEDTGEQTLTGDAANTEDGGEQNP